MALFPQKKSSKIFWGIGLFFVAVFLFLEGYYYYDQWRGERRVEELARALQKWEQEIYNKKAADKIGGKTPSETLQMFIAAVEKGDYELASKYFVIEKQEKWKKELQGIIDYKKSDIFLNPIKEAQNNLGEYSQKKDTYSIHKPILVSFILYPSSNWKIEEI
jgi:hypothetical protein